MSTGLDRLIEESRNEFEDNSDTRNDSTTTDDTDPPDGLEESLELLIERGNPMADAAERALDRL